MTVTKENTQQCGINWKPLLNSRISLVDVKTNHNAAAVSLHLD